MKTQINHPVWSKINWTALAIALVGLAAAANLIPEEAKEPLTEIVMITGPVLVMVWRTWFTDPGAPEPTVVYLDIDPYPYGEPVPFVEDEPELPLGEDR